MEKIKKELTTIYILWLRQIKRHLRSKSRLFISIIQPMLFLLAFGFGFQNIYAKAGAGNYLDFLGPGIIAMSVLFSAMFAGIEVISDKQFGFLKETLVAPISRFSIILGRTLGGATVALIQGILVMIVTFIIGVKLVSFSGLLLALLFMVLIAILFTALGTSIATFFNDMQAFPIIINLIIMPLFFLSGALFPLGELPSGFARVLDFNPLSYGVDGIRGGITGVFHYSFAVDMAVVGILSVLVLAWGAYLFNKIEG